jgi:hypothetical protein
VVRAGRESNPVGSGGGMKLGTSPPRFVIQGCGVGVLGSGAGASGGGCVLALPSPEVGQPLTT